VVYFLKLSAGHRIAASREDSTGSLLVSELLPMLTDNTTRLQMKKKALLDFFFSSLLLQGPGIYPAPTEGTGVSDDSTTSTAAGES